MSFWNSRFRKRNSRFKTLCGKLILEKGIPDLILEILVLEILDFRMGIPELYI